MDMLPRNLRLLGMLNQCWSAGGGVVAWSGLAISSIWSVVAVCPA